MVFHCLVAFRNVGSVVPAEASWEHREVFLRLWEGESGVTRVSARVRNPQSPLQMGTSVMPRRIPG